MLALHSKLHVQCADAWQTFWWSMEQMQLLSRLSPNCWIAELNAESLTLALKWCC